MEHYLNISDIYLIYHSIKFLLIKSLSNGVDKESQKALEKLSEKIENMLSTEQLEAYKINLDKYGTLGTHKTEVLIKEVKDLQKQLEQARTLAKVYSQYFAYNEEVESLKLPWEIK